MTEWKTGRPALSPAAPSLFCSRRTQTSSPMRVLAKAGVWLRFFTTQPDANDQPANRSVPRAVAYQLVRRRNGGQYAYQLYRSQVRQGGAEFPPSVPATVSSPRPTRLRAGSAQNPGNVRRPNARRVPPSRNNVVDFGVRIIARCRQWQPGPGIPLRRCSRPVAGRDH